MAAVKRSFRAENMLRLVTEGADNNDPAYRDERRHQELMAEIASIKTMLADGASAGGGEEKPFNPQEVGQQFMDEFKKELNEAAKLKTELDAIYEAIAQTKREIATLHHTTGSEGEEMASVTNELDAVVLGTEGATENILSAAEFIDETANTLSAHLAGRDADMANDIQERVVEIFEACNFQDLTGQRITKVVGTLRFIEERIMQMMDIWGGIDTFKDIKVDTRPKAEGDAALLNGPALEDDTNVASQDDIDALFS